MLHARELAEGFVYFTHDALARPTEQQYVTGGAAY